MDAFWHYFIKYMADLPPSPLQTLSWRAPLSLCLICHTDHSIARYRVHTVSTATSSVIFFTSDLHQSRYHPPIIIDGAPPPHSPKLLGLFYYTHMSFSHHNKGSPFTKQCPEALIGTPFGCQKVASSACI